MKRSIVLAVLMLMAALPVAAQNQWFGSLLPRPEINVGLMLPGYFALDLTDAEFRDYQSASDWGVSLFSVQVTFLRWGRVEFGGFGMGWGIRGSGEKVLPSGEVRRPTEHVLYVSTPINVRLSGPMSPDKTGWRLSVSPLVTLVDVKGGDRTTYGVAISVAYTSRAWPH